MSAQIHKGDLSEVEIKRYFESSLSQQLQLSTGGEAQACCPFHKDTDPSLSINVTSGLWHCHAGCGGGSVHDFEMKRLNVDFAEAQRRVHAAVGRVEQERQVEAEYSYVDEMGKLLFQVARFRPKGFAQRQPDEKGGWTWTVKGVRQVPYRLPEVLAAEAVHIVEGEKDADRLHSLGLAATTNSGGAGKWLAEFSRYFSGKHVVVLPDNDGPGKKHAEDVVQNLHTVAASIKVVDLPGLADKGDVSDWLDAGHTPGELVQLVADAPVSQPEDKAKEIIRQIPSIWEVSVPPVEWAVNELVPLGCVTLLAGAPDIGKTWFGLSIAKAITSGQQFLGRSTSARKVIYCDRENPLAVIKDRLDIIKFEPTPDFHYWGFHCKTAPLPLDDADAYAQVARSISPRPVFIFDTLLRFHSAESENSASDMSRVMEKLKKIASAGAAVVVLHHKGKSEANAYRGSSDILAAVDLALVLSGNGESAPLRLHSAKNRLGEALSMTLRLSPNGGGFTVVSDPKLEREQEELSQLEEYISAHPGECQQEIVQAMEERKIPVARIRQGLERGTNSRWHIKRGPHNRKEFHPGVQEVDELEL